MLRFPVTGAVAAAAIGVSVYYWTGGDISALLMNRRAFEGELWRLLTPALPHGGFLHLLFNLYWLIDFGRVLEVELGRRRVALVYAALAAGSTAAEYAVFRGGIGLSGVVYGCFGFLWIAGRRERVLSRAVDRETVQLFVGWFFLCIVLTYAEVWNIGNVAHGSGAVLGMLMGAAYVATPERRLFWRSATVGALLLTFVGATAARPFVNFNLTQLAYDALIDEDYELAIDLYQQTLSVDDEQWDCWYNLGYAHELLGQREEALNAYRRSYELNPHDPDTPVVLAELLRLLEEEARSKGELERADALASEARALERLEE